MARNLYLLSLTITLAVVALNGKKSLASFVRLKTTRYADQFTDMDYGSAPASQDSMYENENQYDVGNLYDSDSDYDDRSGDRNEYIQKVRLGQKLNVTCEKNQWIGQSVSEERNNSFERLVNFLKPDWILKGWEPV